MGITTMVFTHEAYDNRPTRAEISIPALINNFNIVRSLINDNVKIMAMVKANAYGHGITRVAREFLKAGADFIGVAYLEEAMFLRHNGITAPILVLGAINTEQVGDFIANNVEITSSSTDKSHAISKMACKLNKEAIVHLKVDTGMERIGVHWYHVERFIEETLAMENIVLKGVFSHLSKAESDKAYTEKQISRFEEVVNFLDKKNCLPELIHLANSAGIINHRQSHFNMVRPGIMLYGYNPNGYLPEVRFEGQKLIPAMMLKTKVSYFKVVPKDTGISYNHTYTTNTQTRVVTLPIGYGDGYNRLLSNQGEVAIRSEKYRIAGSICMDQTMIDIGPDGTAFNGEDVLLFGEMDGQTIPLESLCEKIGTITYELLCNISSRVPRVYFKE